MAGRLRMAAQPLAPVQVVDNKVQQNDKKAEQKGASVFRLKSLECPIGQEQFVKPVMAYDGHTYEEKEFKTWTAKSQLSPVTLLPLGKTTTQINHVVTQAVEEYEREVVPLLQEHALLKKRLAEIETDVVIWKSEQEEKEREFKRQNNEMQSELQRYKKSDNELRATLEQALQRNERLKQKLRVKNEELERLRQEQVRAQAAASAPSQIPPVSALPSEAHSAQSRSSAPAALSGVADSASLAPLNSLLAHPGFAPALSGGLAFFSGGAFPQSTPLPAVKLGAAQQLDAKHLNRVGNHSQPPASARPVLSNQVVQAANLALKNAIGLGQVDAVRQALADGANANVRFGALKETPMMLAVDSYSTDPKSAQEIMILLSQSRADLNLVDLAGDGALHRAVQQNHEWPVRFLLRKGASPLLVNAAGQTPSAKILKCRQFNSAVVNLLLRSEKLFGQRRREDTPLSHRERRAHSAHAPRRAH